VVTNYFLQLKEELTSMAVLVFFEDIRDVIDCWLVGTTSSFVIEDISEELVLCVLERVPRSKELCFKGRHLL
jgi:hypothetical protein